MVCSAVHHFDPKIGPFAGKAMGSERREATMIISSTWKLWISLIAPLKCSNIWKHHFDEMLQIGLLIVINLANIWIPMKSGSSSLHDWLVVVRRGDEEVALPLSFPIHHMWFKKKCRWRYTLYVSHIYMCISPYDEWIYNQPNQFFTFHFSYCALYMWNKLLINCWLNLINWDDTVILKLRLLPLIINAFFTNWV